ncbi:MAG TPA: STAS domain-containing protein [Spirochaetota bacterium]|nr:STAS domain-containing protein [Spirochaetota bacterium]HPJ34358.1 STAS domain-containing protein [Spirochaetota bacterium]
MKLRIVKKKNGDDTVLLTMIGELSVYTVSKLKDILLKELETFSGIVMNLEGIDEADTAGFQLLLFLKREANSAGKIFTINEKSTRINSLFSLYNEKI